MSTVTPIIDQVPDRWPPGAVSDDTLGQFLLASNLLGADRAVGG